MANDEADIDEGNGRPVHDVGLIHVEENDLPPEDDDDITEDDGGEAAQNQNWQDNKRWKT